MGSQKLAPSDIGVGSQGPIPGVDSSTVPLESKVGLGGPRFTFYRSAYQLVCTGHWILWSLLSSHVKLELVVVLS